MTTTVPTFSHQTATQAFLATTFAAATLLILLFWMMTGITGATGVVADPPTGTLRPSPQAQIAPRPAHQTDPTTQH